MAGSVMQSGKVNVVVVGADRIAGNGDSRLTLGFLFGLVVALWSANAGMKAVADWLEPFRRQWESRLDNLDRHLATKED